MDFVKQKTKSPRVLCSFATFNLYRETKTNEKLFLQTLVRHISDRNLSL